MARAKTQRLEKEGDLMRDMSNEEIKQAICDDYCRFREEALYKHKDPDEAEEWLLDNYCEDCPLGRL